MMHKVLERATFLFYAIASYLMTHTQNIFVATHQLPWVVVVQSEDPLEFVIKKSDESSGLYSGLHSLSKVLDFSSTLDQGFDICWHAGKSPGNPI